MLCLTCGRVRPAANAADYTVERARLIVQHGLCMCTAQALAPALLTPGPGAPIRTH